MNRFCAAPVKVCKDLLKSVNEFSGILINSGCANACTGDQGLKDAFEMSEYATDKINSELKNEKYPFLVMSTGVIGQHLQMQKIKSGILEFNSKVLGNMYENWIEAAKGIMTTDTFPKVYSLSQKNEQYSIAGISKGAGMIHPNMATMLSAIVTDVDITKPSLDAALRYCAERSFNSISVDGDTSTNDSFIVLSNGASKFKINSLENQDYFEFRENLLTVSTMLAQLIVRDGEGATKFITIKVTGALSIEDAKQVANSIAKSPLVKTAFYGKDANWGRIICAVGYSGVDIIADKVKLTLSDKNRLELLLFKDGGPYNVDENIASQILEQTDVDLSVDLGMGSCESTVFTCDLSNEYVNINADYRS